MGRDNHWRNGMQQASYRISAENVLRWTGVCALVPVLMAIVGAAFEPRIEPFTPLTRILTWAAVLFLPPLCVGLQWYALRRFAPRLTLWMWAGASVIALIASAFMPSWLRQAETDFSLAMMNWRAMEAASFSITSHVMLTLAKIVGLTVAVSLVASLVQILVMSVATKLPWKIFLIAAIAGAGAQALLAHLPDFLGIFRQETLHNELWGNLLVELTLRACAGASYGIASAFTISRLLVPAAARTDDESRQVGLGLALATLLVICVPVSIDIFGRDGGRAAALRVVKVFTSAPSKDLSHGENILEYSHGIETQPGRYPVMYYSPDSKYLIVLDREQRLMLVEVETGRQLGQLGDALGLHEGYAVAWSPDSRAVVLRTKGAKDPMLGARESARGYTRHRVELRKYSIPTRQPVGEYLPAADECYESHGQITLIYAPDGNSLWSLCDPRTNTLQPESPMAIELDAVSLRPLRRKLYGTQSAAGLVRTLGIGNGEVIYLQRREEGSIDEIRVGRLSDDDAAVVRTYNLNATGLTAGLLGQREIIEDGRILAAEYCGKPVVKEVAEPKSICRSLEVDMTTGEIVRVSDDVDRRFERHRRVTATRDGLKVVGQQRASSKEAEILVVDDRSGRARQRIETHEQRPLTFSPDKRWLVTYSLRTKALNVYRVAR